MASNWKIESLVLAIVLGLLTSACAIDVEENAAGTAPPQATVPDGNQPPQPSTPPTAAHTEKPTAASAARFLMSASFGPTESSINELADVGYSDWLTTQFELPMRSIVDASWPQLTEATMRRAEHRVPIAEFYENAIKGDDQLRMRATFALSQILVVSTDGSNVIQSDGEGLARYMDILQEGAFGNYRDLLEEVTYSPIMGEYLTYAGNRKADPEKGSAPDENYAREIMQLFTIGLYELNMDGSVKLDGNGRPIETYDTEDITGLSKVFTGLWWHGLTFRGDLGERTQQDSLERMVMHEEGHSPDSKTFLGETIPASYSGNEAISAALDILFEHPNTAPFISRQLIQRMTTSNPSPSYIERVSTAFVNGEYQLPNGNRIGSGERGDMRPVWAAILLDPEFLDADAVRDPTFGKVREPVLRFTHWARMANVPEVKIIGVTGSVVDPLVMEEFSSAQLGQRPFTSSSVFNFYRPGYVAAGSDTANAGLVAPELQITTETSIVAYANYMHQLVLRDEGANWRGEEFGIIGDYESEIALAEDPEALIERLDLILTAGAMTAETRTRLRTLILSIDVPAETRERRLRERVQRAILITVVSPEFLVQQ